jgi:hypothetical protein
MPAAPIPVRPEYVSTKPSTNTPPKPSTNTTNTTNSGGGGGGGVSAAESRAVARENAAKKKAGQKYLAQAANLEAQAKALKYALSNSYGKNRDQNLADLNQALNQQFALLKGGASARAEEFVKAGGDTAKATAGNAEEGASNAVRERQDSLANLLEQGAGETDTIKTMLLAARNWNANQSEGNRAYFDTMRSVNQGITDLNIDTQTGLSNAFMSTEGERDRIWQDFYNRRSESFTQLGNIKGQQRDYYASAKEMGVSPKKGSESAAKKTSEKAFMDASKEAAKSYKQAALPTWISGYKGQAKQEARLSNTNLAAAVQFDEMQKAEGASLRRWQG